MKKLFSLFAAFLFVGSMWATPETIFYESFGSTSSNTAYGSYNGFSAGSNQFARGTAKTNYTGDGKVGRNDLSGNGCSSGYTGASGLSGCYHAGVKNTEKTIIKISNIKISEYSDLHLSFGALGGANNHKVNVTYIIDEGSETSLISNGSLSSSAWTLKEADITGTGDSLTIIIKHTPGNTWTMRLDDIKITGERTSTDPFISSEPSTVEVGEAETSSTISLTYTNITNYLAEISLHDDAAGQESFTGNWLDAEIDDTDYATISYMAEANLGAARTAYIKVYAVGDNDAEVTLIIPVIQAAHVPVITPISNNDAYGTVTLNNNVITATPNAGYRIDDDAPYTVTAGTANVVRGTGNKTNQFTVTPSTDCTVQINFEEIPQYTVIWNNNGNQDVTTQVYEGSKPTFPATPSAFDATSDTFYGWATANWNGKINDLAGKTIHRKARTMPEVKGPVEYFAVFAVENATNSGWFETAIENMTTSDIFVLADQSNYAMTNDKGTSDAPDAVAITVTDGKITSAVPDKLQWNISGNSTDGYTFYPEGSTTWLYCSTSATSGSNNNMRVGSGDRKVFELDGEGILKTKDDNTDRYVCRYSNSDYRGYINKDNGEPIVPHLYKYVAPLYSDYITTELDPTSLEDIDSSVKPVKLLRNGILLIEKNGHTYNAMGQLVK